MTDTPPPPPPGSSSRISPPTTPPDPPSMASAPSGPSASPVGRRPRPLPPLGVEGRIRRAVVAVSVCLCGATPSFALAAGEFSVPGMLVGIAIFMIGLTLISWSSPFRRLNRAPFVRRTLTWVYAARLALSIAWPVLFYLDGFPGIFAVGIVQAMGFQDDGTGMFQISGPLGTGLIVLIQGVFLNLILLAAATVLLGGQRMTCPMPAPLEGDTYCGGCRHCLDGIPESHACPECGLTGRRWPEPPTWIDTWSRGRLAIFAIVIPGIVIGVATGLFLAFQGGLP